jgi:uncharacterized CHY-type Zn-finger protein
VTVMHEWIVTYCTAEMSRWPSESAAWVAHDRAVIHGLNPDALAVVETAARCGGCRRSATRRNADDVANVCQFCGEESDWVRTKREWHENQLAEQERT